MSLLWKGEKCSQRTSGWRQESPGSVGEVSVGLLFSHSPVTGHNHGRSDLRDHHQQLIIRTVNPLDRFQDMQALVWCCAGGLLPLPSPFSLVGQVLILVFGYVLPRLDIPQTAAVLLELTLVKQLRWVVIAVIAVLVALGGHSNRATTVWASQRSCFHCPKTTP